MGQPRFELGFLAPKAKVVDQAGPLPRFRIGYRLSKFRSSSTEWKTFTHLYQRKYMMGRTYKSFVPSYYRLKWPK